MQLISPDSIFRCMPTALPLKVRRLLGAFAYAVDGAELSYFRLTQTAESYAVPPSGTSPSVDRWTPFKRLSLVVDAWAFIDHLTRLRKLLPRFDYDGDLPPRVQSFLAATEPARLIRNRLQHLDEDIYSSAHSQEGHPVLGTISWVDTRTPPNQTRFAVASGPSIDAGKMIEMQVGEHEPGRVCDFRLMASDQSVLLDVLLNELRGFVSEFEVLVGDSVSEGLKAAAVERDIPMEGLCASGITDMTLATIFESMGGDQYQLRQDGMHGLVEVPPGRFRLPGAQ